MTLLGACAAMLDFIQNEKWSKTEKTEHFDAKHVEYDKIKHYAAFYIDILCFFHAFLFKHGLAT